MLQPAHAMLAWSGWVFARNQVRQHSLAYREHQAHLALGRGSCGLPESGVSGKPPAHTTLQRYVLTVVNFSRQPGQGHLAFLCTFA